MRTDRGWSTHQIGDDGKEVRVDFIYFIKL